MLIVKVDLQHGQVVPDKQVIPFVLSYIAQYQFWKHKADVEVVIGSEIIVDAFRLAIVEDKISHDDIVFVYGDVEVKLNPYAYESPNVRDGEHSNIVIQILQGISLKKQKHYMPQ